MNLPSVEDITAKLAEVIDPEIRRPITELGMVRSIKIAAPSKAIIGIDLTTAGCPLRETISTDVKNALLSFAEISEVEVEIGVMNDEQRAKLKEMLRGGTPERAIPFAKPGNLTQVYAISSGKGGVGKSSMTVNLATAMARSGLKVGIVDADIYGFSIPQMMGITTPPQIVDSMIIPPVAHDVKVISIGMFIAENTPVVWRGPMLHRALEQFFADVFWGDLDVLLIDLPPGTGDIAISVAQLIPNAEIVVVTTPQAAAAEVAERAGMMAKQTEQRVVGVIENMSYLITPDGGRMELFGKGGGQTLSTQLSALLGYEVPLLAQIPIEQALREGGDCGIPLAISDQDSPAGDEITQTAQKLANRTRGLSGRSLSVSPL
ncbi:Mrp/NBP35 family ATP-binding protein [Arcanobacterium hippocoleae]|uniref:Iron-sulfur cluster carrier protein n=1 Tax=Arcanobacterium hippocoleae TaxID=149017 RepID=A0ABU1SZU5_9ACTO|nr:P-loop NTPase [Arcanobacterium hippocoleae]MDR6938649.1 ATP-binding protein involved in chromosome partitioning [Arcanobacterium hippocoleae]